MAPKKKKKEGGGAGGFKPPPEKPDFDTRFRDLSDLGRRTGPTPLVRNSHATASTESPRAQGEQWEADSLLCEAAMSGKKSMLRVLIEKKGSNVNNKAGPVSLFFYRLMSSLAPS